MTYLLLPIPFRSTCAIEAAVGVSEAGILGSSSGLLLLWSRFVFIFNPFSWSVFQMSKAICLVGLFCIFFVCSFSCGSPPSGFGGLFIHRVAFSSFSLLHVCSLYLNACASVCFWPCTSSTRPPLSISHGAGLVTVSVLFLLLGCSSLQCFLSPGTLKRILFSPDL